MTKSEHLEEARSARARAMNATGDNKAFLHFWAKYHIQEANKPDDLTETLNAIGFGYMEGIDNACT